MALWGSASTCIGLFLLVIQKKMQRLWKEAMSFLSTGKFLHSTHQFITSLEYLQKHFFLSMKYEELLQLVENIFPLVYQL